MRNEGRDLVERHHDMLYFWLVELQDEEGRRSLSRNRDCLPLEILARKRFLRHEPGSVPISHRRSGREQSVAVREVRVGMDGNRRDLELPFKRPAVQAFDVRKLMHEA